MRIPTVDPSVGDRHRFLVRIEVNNGLRRTLLGELVWLCGIVSIGEKKNCVGRATERRFGQPLGIFNNEARKLRLG